MIAHAKETVEYRETGDGVPLVFVPGSFSTGSSWRNISTPLSERYRTITTSLSGYGKTQERRRQRGFYMQDEMDCLNSSWHKPKHLCTWWPIPLAHGSRSLLPCTASQSCSA